MAEDAKTRLPPITKGNKRKIPAQVEDSNSNAPKEKVFITQNRFAALSTLINDPNQEEIATNKEDTEMYEENDISAGITITKKSQKPPPIIFHGKPSVHKQFVKFIQSNTNKPFNIKYSEDNTTIYITDVEDWKTQGSA